MTHAVFAGSFDPPTLGHIDVIARAAAVFETIHVLVAANRNKNSLFDPEKRLGLIAECTSDIPNVRVAVWEGLVVDYARQNGCTVLVRGIRGIIDFAAEYDMALLNSRLAPELQTLLMCADPRYSDLSSSAIKEFAHYGRDVSDLVPGPVLVALEQWKS